MSCRRSIKDVVVRTLIHPPTPAKPLQWSKNAYFTTANYAPWSNYLLWSSHQNVIFLDPAFSDKPNAWTFCSIYIDGWKMVWILRGALKHPKTIVVLGVTYTLCYANDGLGWDGVKNGGTCVRKVFSCTCTRSWCCYAIRFSLALAHVVDATLMDANAVKKQRNNPIAVSDSARAVIHKSQSGPNLDGDETNHSALLEESSWQSHQPSLVGLCLYRLYQLVYRHRKTLNERHLRLKRSFLHFAFSTWMMSYMRTLLKPSW